MAVTLPGSKRLNPGRSNEAFLAWLFSAPAIILLIVFLVVPFIMAIVLGFTNQRLIPNPNLPTQLIGFRNFTSFAPVSCPIPSWYLDQILE